MTLPVLFLVSSALPQYADAPNPEPPVQVWLDEDGSYDRGDYARVFARAAWDGYLVVLHADADGRVRVLFPVDPGADDFVRGAESIEVRGRADREAFFVEENSGSGLVLAAWSPDPFRFGDFVRADHWDYRALDSDNMRRDPERGLLDIVHHMAAGASYEYDVAPYVIGDHQTGEWFDGYVVERRPVNVTVRLAPYGCYGCYDPWGWRLGVGYATGSWYFNVGWGSSWYRPWYYRPYRPVYWWGYDPWRWQRYYRPPVRVVWSRPWRGPVRVGHPWGDPWCGYRCDRGPVPGHATGVRLTDAGFWPDIEPRSSRPEARPGLVRQTLQTRIAEGLAGEGLPSVNPRSTRSRSGIAAPQGPTRAEPAGAPIWSHRSTIPESDPFRARRSRDPGGQQDARPARASDRSASAVRETEPRRDWRSTVDPRTITRPNSSSPSDRARPRDSTTPVTPPRTTPSTSRSRIWSAEPPTSTPRPTRSDRSAIQRRTEPPPSRGSAADRARTPPSRTLPSSVTPPARTRDAGAITRSRSATTRVAPSRASTPSRVTTPPRASTSGRDRITTRYRPPTRAPARTTPPPRTRTAPATRPSRRSTPPRAAPPVRSSTGKARATRSGSGRSGSARGSSGRGSSRGGSARGTGG